MSNALPQYLTHQALSPSAHLRVLTPTVFEYRFDTTGEMTTVRLDEEASVTQLFEFPTVEKFFEYRRIHREAFARSSYHYLRPLLTEPTKHSLYPKNQSGLNAAQIALNAERKAEELKLWNSQQDYRSMLKAGLSDTRRYHLKALDQHCLITCPVTGIVFEVSLPSIPVFLIQQHPLASLVNIQSTLDWFLITSKVSGRLMELDTPILAGMLLVLLRSKHLLLESETSVLAENATLQFIPKGTLCHYLSTLHKSWSLDKVWQNMPLIRLNAEGQSVLATLEEWFKRASLHLAGKPIQDISVQAKLFEATRFKSNAERTIKIYSAETGQHKKLLQTKSDAHILYKQLAPLMSPVLKSLVHSTLQDLIVVTVEAKTMVSEALSKQFLGTKQQDAATQLISLIMAVETGHIAKGLERASDAMNIPVRSISQILAAKQQKGKGN